MVIQYKRGYSPQYTVHGELSLLWGIKEVPVEEESYQSQLTFLFVSEHLSLFTVVVERAAMKALSSIPNALILDILDKSNMS